MASEIQISVIIPSFNYAKLLPKAIKSVMPQLAKHHELIIIDDGSTDNTPEVLDQLNKEFSDTLQTFRKINGGASSARNLGIEKSKGSYLIFLDADDELTPHALSYFERHIEEHPDSRMIIGGHTSIFPNGKRREHTPSQLPQSALEMVRSYLIEKTLALSNGACAMHRDVFSRGNYPEQFRSAEDFPVFTQALAHYHCTILPHSIALIYKHDDSLRHQFNHAKAGGLALVDEVFSPARVGQEFQSLKKDFYVQRCLSLFRSAYQAKDIDIAKQYYRAALSKNWRIIFNKSYLRKFLRLLLKKRSLVTKAL